MLNSTVRVAALAAIAALGIATPASAADPAKAAFLAARPCGPDSMTGPLRYFIPQGVFGADFRPACRAHDDCYARSGATQAGCDLQWRNDMLCACEQSRTPRLCRATARFMSNTVGRFGGDAFRIAQSAPAR